MTTINLLLFSVVLALVTGAVDIDWSTVTASKIQSLVQSGTSCQEIIRAFLDRIRKFEQDPGLGAVITINENALADAARLDDAYQRSKRLSGSLHCVPVLPKDIINVANVPTTGGLNALRENVPSQSSTIVQAMQNQGAIVVGKANLSPMAGAADKSTSETGGLAKNPYDLSRTTWGSSGGNGAAGAAVYTIIGLGTDTSGSVVLPSAAGSLVGLRPTMNKLSNNGVAAGNHLQDTVGPMARWAEDIAAAMDVLDPWTNNRGYPVYKTPAVLSENGLNGMRIATLYVRMRFVSKS